MTNELMENLKKAAEAQKAAEQERSQAAMAKFRAMLAKARAAKEAAPRDAGNLDT